MASCRITPYTPRLLGGVATLRRSLFGNSLDASTEYVEWMYGGNPYIEEPPLIVALHDDVVVGMRGTLGTRWECEAFTAPNTLPSLTDTGIAPGYGDRGVYAELTGRILEEYAARGYSHALNLTPNPENFIASTVFTGGFKSIGDHGTLVAERPLSARAAAIARRLRIAIGRRLLARLDGAARTARTPAGVVLSLDDVARPAAMAELVTRLPVDRRLRHVRDARYFAWRYRNPLAHHRFVYAERGTDLVGYAVLQVSRAGGPVDVADLEVVEVPVRTALLDAIAASGLPTVRVWSSTLAPDVLSDLVDHGFTKPPDVDRHADRFILRPLAGGEEKDRWSIDGVDLRRLESWDLRAGIATTY